MLKFLIFLDFAGAETISKPTYITAEEIRPARDIFSARASGSGTGSYSRNLSPKSAASPQVGFSGAKLKFFASIFLVWKLYARVKSSNFQLQIPQQTI